MKNVQNNLLPISISKMINDIVLKYALKFLTSVVRNQLYFSEVRNYNKMVTHMVSKCLDWHSPWRYLLITSDLDWGM